MTVVEGRGRHDLSQPKDGVQVCERPAAEGCAYTVEVEYELIMAERADLDARILRAFEPYDFPHCDEDLRFAINHGLPAYRDMCGIRNRVISECSRLPPR